MSKPSFLPFFIMSHLDSPDAWRTAGAQRAVYVSEQCAKVSFWGVEQTRTLQLMMLERSPSITAKFTRYRFEYDGVLYSQAAAIENLLSVLDYELKGLVAVLEAMKFSDHGFGVQTASVCGVTVHRSSIPALFVCNPFDTDNCEGERAARLAF